MRLFLVYNPRARLARRVSAQALGEELTRLGAEVQLCEAGEGDEALRAAQQAVKAGVDRIVVAGGDGAVHAVLPALAGTQVPLAVIPLGTGNVLACEAGLRRGAWRRACQVAVGDHLVRLDLGRAGGHLFATMFGAGLDACVVEDLGDRTKHQFGRLAFIGQLLRTLGRCQPARFRLRLDDQEQEVSAWTVLVSNTARYAWRLRFAPEASPSDGWLDVSVFRFASRPSVAAQGALCFLLSSPDLCPSVQGFRTRKLRIETDRPVPWQADGELGGHTPVEIEVVPQALTVVLGDDTCGLSRGR
ncbi:MAG: diacylglycerol kinase family lipid kinase [Armatimonadetes bacterium]|nr:diacylglycerol kinase family lipid kinase [Armatimonadota bacterium]